MPPLASQIAARLAAMQSRAESAESDWQEALSRLTASEVALQRSRVEQVAIIAANSAVHEALTACEAKLREAEARVAELESDTDRLSLSRLRTIVDESCGMQPADATDEELLTLLEARIADWHATSERRRGTIDRLTRERDEALAALGESEASHNDPVWEKLRALAHDALSIEAKLSAQPPSTPARLDESRTAQPKTRLVGHAHEGDRIGPGTVVADTHVDNETGKRTGLTDGGVKRCPGCKHAPHPNARCREQSPPPGVDTTRADWDWEQCRCISVGSTVGPVPAPRASEGAFTMTWTYDYSDRPRPSYRIQDGSDDGDVAECWDEDVAKAIVAAMNSAPTGTSPTVSPSRSSEENRKPAPEPAKAPERKDGA